jgi:acetylornithine deacetylase/succinyl-diaminopimelate desuccinylase-like protein
MESTTLIWCKRLIACRSLTREGTRAAAELCAAELLAPHGIEARLIPSAGEGDTQINLFAFVPGRDRAAAPLVLNTHLDTVPPGDTSLWTECAGDPFAATVAADRIYGLGAADTKLDFIAKITALAESRPPRRDVYLVGTFGEEHGMVGAREIAEAGLLPRGALAFVGEPSHLQVITAHKGLIMFRLTVGFAPQPEASAASAATRIVFEGRSAHSSTPALGHNAIRATLEALNRRPDLPVRSIAGGDAVNKVPARCEVVVDRTSARDFAASLAGAAAAEPIPDNPRQRIPAHAIAILARFIDRLQDFANRAGPPEPDYAAPTLTCNPGVIRSSAGSVMLEFELRPPPALALDVVRDGVAQIVAGLRREAASPDLTLAEVRSNPAFRSDSASETVELAMAALAGAGLPLDSGVKTGCTEAGIYHAAGLVPVVIGPGPSTGVIHAPNEYNFLADVDGAIRFYRSLLQL